MKKTIYDFSKYTKLSKAVALKIPILELTERKKTADLYWSVYGMFCDRLMIKMVEKYTEDSFDIIFFACVKPTDKKAVGWNGNDYRYIPIDAARTMFNIAAKAIEESLKIFVHYSNKCKGRSWLEIEEYLYTCINKNHLSDHLFVTLDEYLYKKENK